MAQRKTLQRHLCKKGGLRRQTRSLRRKGPTRQFVKCCQIFNRAANRASAFSALTRDSRSAVATRPSLITPNNNLNGQNGGQAVSLQGEEGRACGEGKNISHSQSRRGQESKLSAHSLDRHKEKSQKTNRARERTF